MITCMPEASLVDLKLRLNKVLTETVCYEKNNPYNKSKISMVLANHQVKSLTSI